jgi:hypothetical protein
LRPIWHRRGRGCGLSGSVEQALGGRVIAAQRDASALAAGALTEGAVDQVRACNVQAFKLGHVDDGARRQSVCELTQIGFQMGDGVHRPIAA